MNSILVHREIDLALVVAIAFLATGCATGPEHVASTIDFSEIHGQATCRKLLPAESGGCQDESAKPKQVEDGLRQAAGTELAFPLVVPDDALLAISGVQVAPGSSPGQVTAEVLVRRGNGVEAPLLRTDNHASMEARSADLSSHAGELIELLFRVKADAPDSSIDVVWENPRLAGTRDSRSQTNVLLIVIDTLRADYLSCYDGDAETPNIDALAASGVTFANAYSHIPITGPSHSSIFTSKLPSQHGVRDNMQVLQPEHNTLAEIMQGLGHETAAFVSLGVLAGNGFRQGFDVYEDHFHGVWWKTATQVNAEVESWLSTLGDRSFFLWTHYSDPHEPYASPDGVFPEATVAVNGEPAGTFSVNATRIRVPVTLRPGANEMRIVVPGGATFREVRTTEPDVEIEYSDEWNLIVWQGAVYQATSGEAASLTLSNPQSESRDLTFEFFAHEPVTAELARRRYREEVEFVDREIGKLLDELEQRGLLDDTLVVLTADHGESLGEHDHIGHISQLYETLVRIPLILSHQTMLPRGKRIEEPVAHVDILPTVLDSLGLPENVSMEGTSLLPLIDGEPSDPARTVLMETHRTEPRSDLRAILTGGLKLIRNDTQSTVEAYDLKADPDELTNLADGQHPIVESLNGSLDSEFAAALSRGKSDTRRRAISQEELEKLRSLGYVH